MVSASATIRSTIGGGEPWQASKGGGEDDEPDDRPGLVDRDVQTARFRDPLEASSGWRIDRPSARWSGARLPMK